MRASRRCAASLPSACSHDHTEQALSVLLPILEQHAFRCKGCVPLPCSLKPTALQVLRLMETSLFSIVLPGDAQSTRRLSEVFMGGSIPVFIGPPYHSMPFSDYVDYRCSACSSVGLTRHI